MSDSAAGARAWARDTAWILGANVLKNLGLIVILVLLARLTSADAVGRYALALATTTPIFVMAQFGMRSVYLTMQREYRFGSYLSLQAVAASVAIIVSVAIAAVFSPGIIVTVAIVAGVKAVDSFAELLSGPLQRGDASVRIFSAYLTNAALGGATTAGLLMAGAGLDLALVGLLASTVLSVGLIMARRATELTSAPATGDARKREWIGILRAGLPIGATNAVLALVSSLPQYFLASEHGDVEVGVFAVLLYVLAVADIFSGTLTLAWIPQATEALRASPDRAHFAREVLKNTGRWTLAFVPITLAGLALAVILLPLVFGSEYALKPEYAFPLGLGVLAFPLVHFGGTAILVRNLYNHVMLLSVVAVAVSLLACAILIPPYGVAGALWASASAIVVRGIAAQVVLATARLERGNHPPITAAGADGLGI